MELELNEVIENLEYLVSDSCTDTQFDYIEEIEIATKALEKQEKIKEIIANANKWSKEDIVVKAQAFCDIEKILRSDEE